MSWSHIAEAALPGRRTDARILRDQVKLLYTRGRTAFAATALNAVILGFVLWRHADHHVLTVWMVAVGGMALIRYGLGVRYFERTRALSDREWAHLFTWMAGFNGVIWGALALLVWRSSSMTAEILLAVVLVGMAAGSAALSASYLPAFVAFTVPATVPLLVLLLRAPDRVQSGAGVLLCVFLGFLFLVARAGGRTLRLSSDMRIRLEELNRTLEHRIADRTADLQAALRTRDEFLSVAAHELRTPITSLRLQLQLLERSLSREAGGEQAGARFATMRRQIGRLAGLVDTLLDVSRLAEGRLQLAPRRTDLSAVVSGVLSEVEEDLARKECPLRQELEKDVIGNWDPLRIEQIVTNLIVNAAKHGAGTPITVTLSADEETARLAVRDCGPGIPEDSLERVFGRYERVAATRSDGGLGLGLFVVDQLVKAMGGRVWATSRVGAGAQFTVELPRGRSD